MKLLLISALLTISTCSFADSISTKSCDLLMKSTNHVATEELADGTDNEQIIENLFNEAKESVANGKAVACSLSEADEPAHHQYNSMVSGLIAASMMTEDTEYRDNLREVVMIIYKKFGF